MKRRKNFFPTVVLTVILWLIFGLLIFFIPPQSTIAIFVFFLLLFLSVFFPTSMLLANTRRGFILSLGLVIFFLMRLFGLGNILNALLLAGVVLALEYYLTK